jgi:hypothetical protein
MVDRLLVLGNTDKLDRFIVLGAVQLVSSFFWTAQIRQAVARNPCSEERRSDGGYRAGEHR